MGTTPFKLLETRFKNLSITDKNIILEIGSERGEGSSLFFYNLAKDHNIDFYSIDVVPDAKNNCDYINFIVAKSGHEWCMDVLPTLNKKIKILYLDNFDWIYPSIAHFEWLNDQIKSYADRGIIMNNDNSQEEHRLQSIFCIPYMDEESIVFFDDTWVDDSLDSGYDGKCGKAIQLFINAGFIIENNPQYGLLAYRLSTEIKLNRPLINIKINFGYKEILSYNGNKIDIPLFNLKDVVYIPKHCGDYNKIKQIEDIYDIKFPIDRKDINIPELRDFVDSFYPANLESAFDRTYNTFNSNTIKHFYDKNESFIYPIIIYDNNLFYNTTTIDFPFEVKEFLDKCKCRILIIQPTEGFIGIRDTDFIWISNLAKTYNINKEQLIVVTSNFCANDKRNNLIKNNIIEDNFILYEFNHFEHSLWFLDINELNVDIKRKMFNNFLDCLDKNRKIQKNKHFLCFNRRTPSKPHRVALYGELMSNNILKETSIATLGGSMDGNIPNYYHEIDRNVRSDYKYDKDRLLSFISTLDSNTHKHYDCLDMDENKAGNINIVAHNSTFVNIVTESLLSKETIFFSEKTFKPIYMLQPFILFGNPFSLKTLKRLGYQTFDKWWDESYDNEVDFTRRLEKIMDIIHEISTWSLEKCFIVTNEMEGVLVNNFNRLISDEETIKLYNFLGEDCKNSIEPETETNYQEIKYEKLESEQEIEIKKLRKLI